MVLESWGQVEQLEVEVDQARFVAPISKYRELCTVPGSVWRGYAIQREGHTSGFVMTALETDPPVLTVGGLMIDRAEQRLGLATRAMEILIQRASAQGVRTVALTCDPANVVALRVYAKLGLIPTGESDGIEHVFVRRG